MPLKRFKSMKPKIGLFRVHLILILKKIIMKLLIQTAVLFSLIFHFSFLHAQKTVKGDGNVTTKTVTVGDYDAIKCIGFMDIQLQKGTEGNITVAAEDNLHEQVEVFVEDKELIVKTKEGVKISTKKGIYITVPIDDISKLSVAGSGDVKTKDKITAKEFKTLIQGSGDIVLELEASKADVAIDGSGDISLTGSSDDLKIILMGSGDFEGFKFNANNTEVSVLGSGDASVIAEKYLKARVMGSGDIYYKGNPENTDLKTFGSGDITSR